MIVSEAHDATGPHPAAATLEVVYTQSEEDLWIASVAGDRALSVTGRQFRETRRRLRRRLRGELGRVPALSVRVELMAPLEDEIAAFATQYHSLHTLQHELADARLRLAKRALKLGLPLACVAERLLFSSAVRLGLVLQREATSKQPTGIMADRRHCRREAQPTSPSLREAESAEGQCRACGEQAPHRRTENAAPSPH